MKTNTSIMLREKGFDKEASSAEELSKNEILQGLLGMAVSAGAGVAGSMIFDSIKSKLHRDGVKRHIITMGAELKQDPAFAEAPEKAKARLYEIARIAPHVTLNKELTRSIIKSKLHNGLTDDDKQGLALLQAQYHRQPNVSSFMPKIASADLGEIIADAIMIKEAAVSGNMKAFGALALLPIASGIIGGAINIGMAHVEQKNLKASLDKSFIKALSLSDVDKEPLLQNKERAKDAFTTLARFAPQVALDPHAARAFMNKIVSYDQGVDMSTIKELSEITRNLQDTTRKSPFTEGFSGASSFVGAPGIIAAGMKRHHG